MTETVTMDKDRLFELVARIDQYHELLLMDYIGWIERNAHRLSDLELFSEIANAKRLMRIYEEEQEKRKIKGMNE